MGEGDRVTTFWMVDGVGLGVGAWKPPLSPECLAFRRWAWPCMTTVTDRLVVKEGRFA